MTKKILITGKNSYIGNQLVEWLYREPKEYEIKKESVRDGKWEDINFSIYDVVVHVAGIAHQDAEADQEDLYYRINTNLTIDIASKAKAAGVKQFIFMSSMIVYGASSKIGKEKIITKDTKPEPTNFYGNSKLLAEKGILKLHSENFNVVVIRPPMIYGKGSKGNYHLLAKATKFSPIFPNLDNQRSMIHIENLTEFIRLLIKNEEMGIFFPQNKDYVNTSEMILFISLVHNKKIYLTNIFNPFIKYILGNLNMFTKVFGSFVYEKSMSTYKEEYTINDLSESIKKTEVI